MGGFLIRRRAKPNLLTASAANTAQVKDPSGTTGSMVNIGTPVLSFNSSMGGVYDIPFAMQFNLDELMGYSEITGICDKFKIERVNIVVNGYNVAQVNGNLTYVPMPWIDYVYDYDDSTVPSISTFEEKMGIKTKGFDQRGMLKMSVAPKVVAYSTEGYSLLPAKATWVDSGTPQQSHYGIKGVIRNVNLYDTKSCGYKFTATYTVRTKNLQ